MYCDLIWSSIKFADEIATFVQYKTLYKNAQEVEIAISESIVGFNLISDFNPLSCMFLAWNIIIKHNINCKMAKPIGFLS